MEEEKQEAVVIAGKYILKNPEIHLSAERKKKKQKQMESDDDVSAEKPIEDITDNSNTTVRKR
jgi:hypothetical protein